MKELLKYFAIAGAFVLGGLALLYGSFYAIVAYKFGK